MTCREVEPLLNPRLDDELDITGAAAVDHHLSECRVCAGQYSALQRLHEEIAAADLSYVPSPALERKITAGLPREKKPGLSFPSRWWNLSWIGAAAAVAAVFLFLHVPARVVTEDDLSAEVLDNHLRALQPSHLVDVPSSDRHTVKPWFQGKTSFSPPTPDLTDQGFVLVGGRL